MPTDQAHELASLISDLEMATGPSRTLEARIAVALFKSRLHDDLYVRAELPENHIAPDDGGAWFWMTSDNGCVRTPQRVPRYTESIDAALKLVPEGWHRRQLFEQPDGRWVARARRIFDAELIALDNAPAPTAAIALCIVSLRAGSMP